MRGGFDGQAGSRNSRSIDIDIDRNMYTAREVIWTAEWDLVLAELLLFLLRDGDSLLRLLQRASGRLRCCLTYRHHCFSIQSSIDRRSRCKAGRFDSVDDDGARGSRRAEP